MIERNFVTRETLAAIEDVNRRCHELHVPAPPVVFVTTELFERGVPVLRQREQARSWTRNFYNYMASLFLPATTRVDPGSVGFGAGSTKMKSISGSITAGGSDAIARPGLNYVSYFVGPDTSADYGLFVGTGTSPSSFNDYALQSFITNGTGSGQMSWTAAVNPDPIYDSGTKKWTKTFYRDFSNNSGGSISVGETGVYWYIYYDDGKRAFYMVEHNTLASPVAVADGQILRVTYTIEMTFPA